MYTKQQKSLVMLTCFGIVSIILCYLWTGSGTNNQGHIHVSLVDNATTPWFFPHKNPQRYKLFHGAVTPPPLEKRQVQRNHFDGTDGNLSEPKILLFWNSFAGSPSWRGETGMTRFRHCPYKNCRAEINKTYTEAADFVLFSGVDRVKEFPTVRHPRQIYGVYVGESPSNNHRMKAFNFRMNLTATERLDADVSCRHRFEPKPEPTPGPYRPRIPFSNKTRPVAWMVSNCNAASNRRKYVRALSKFIDVKIYGKCGNLECARGKFSGSNPCFQTLERKYLFYLSFENSICKDYVTEKLYNPLQHEIVPIVMGGGNYSVIAPPNSYIDVREFNSPRQLAEYLRYLSRHEDEYLQYFRWKNSLQFVHYNIMCAFCEIMTKGTFHRTAETWDIDEWYQKGACDNSLVSKLL